MKRSTLHLLALPVAAVLTACGARTPSPGSSSGPAPTAEAGLAAFETVRSVLQHARCQNCHPRGDVPLQGDDGHPHNQNVLRGPDGHGMVGERCTTCHGPINPPDSYGEHTPPGVSTGWRMPKPEQRLVFVGVAPGALCEQIKDPARNGGKDMAALREHLDDRSSPGRGPPASAASHPRCRARRSSPPGPPGPTPAPPARSSPPSKRRRDVVPRPSDWRSGHRRSWPATVVVPH